MKNQLIIVVLVTLLSCLQVATADDVHNQAGWDGNYLSVFDQSKDKWPKSFDSLLLSQVPSSKAAGDLAFGFLVSKLAMRQYQGVRVIGLYQAAMTGGRGIPNFAAPGDWVWVVLVEAGSGIEGIIVIDAQTKKLHALAPES